VKRAQFTPLLDRLSSAARGKARAVP